LVLAVGCSSPQRPAPVVPVANATPPAADVTDIAKARARQCATLQHSGKPEFRAHAEAIASYVARFLTAPDGTFYVSQDADVGAHDDHAAFVDGHRYYASNERERLQLGQPDIDRHVYAAENGLMIAVLVAWFEASHDERALGAARRAADAILASHVEVAGCVLHDAKSSDKVHFLADAAAFGNALTRLFLVTREPSYLAGADRRGPRVAFRRYGGHVLWSRR
jgi:uncharacterized protein YyaL (SSP411 family)